jgi:hypothetical protein
VSIVDLSNWEFVFDILAHTKGVTRPPRVIKFATAVEFVRYLANEKRDGDGEFQRQIHERLKDGLIN